MRKTQLRPAVNRQPGSPRENREAEEILERAFERPEILRIYLFLIFTNFRKKN